MFAVPTRRPEFFEPSTKCIVESTRVTKITYGSRGGINYDSLNPEHSKRSHLPVLTSISGVKHLGGSIFWVLLPSCQPTETEEFRRAHCWEFDNLSRLSTASTAVWGYEETILDAAFMDLNTYYELIMLFGGTELKAWLAWKENGVERRSAANLIVCSG
ncbi:uncharacterized protein LACBIDRAFT_327597 [Laccaria bicolor S238N-H82]|uniref:Predicted protein n=1 Tax=Laccaria bicolor (strain S238N-H82 / ATCC MYA-4686) TaxID=486041 RepID=B0DC79_LACBS|nr:uncharacterized protein LACBIDRAFT_327597 [Laccaria bicolor S238N-H82]EDR07850.1 predicted protein [Laccaria bicolor S238N-H82]|eukprot:XP_001881639.1 predicted protein [Laccaria bicolor S238N-H82]